MENKENKFKRLAELRVRNCHKQIRLIGNLSNKNNYSYKEEDIKKIFKSIRSALNKAEARFYVNEDSDFTL